MATNMDLACPPGKSSWPELVGKKGEAAAMKIEKENPNVYAIIVQNGTPIPGDISCSRVWVFVNTHGIVVSTPHVG